MTSLNETKKLLANLFRAKFPLIYIKSWEENRVIRTIQEITKDKKLIKNPRIVYSWSVTNGIVNLDDKEDEYPEEYGLIDTIKEFILIKENAILILKDAHEHLTEVKNSIEIKRIIRDCYEELKNSEYSKNIVFVSPVLNLPLELEKEITVVDFPLPSEEEIIELLDLIIDENLENNTLTQDDKITIAKTAQGLTLQEVENAFARALIERKKLTLDELDIIMEEKCQVIKKTGMLEFVKTDLNMNDIGGLENLKTWLKKRNNSWSEKALKKYHLPAPKGVLITGVMGCGKSMTAKAISSMWKLPLLRLDAGKIFDKWVGGSEENVRKVIKVAEAVAPSILWIDEIEKGFNQGDGNDDTTSRVFGTFLTWMNEKTKPVFIVATANNISALPAEMLRKGRFDEIFWVDLPNEVERKAIFKLHLNKMLKNSASESFEITNELLKKLTEMTEGFVGAEIQQAIVEAVFEAFSDDRVLEENDLFNAIKSTVPLSITQKEQVDKIREWGKNRTVPASKI